MRQLVVVCGALACGSLLSLRAQNRLDSLQRLTEVVVTGKGSAKEVVPTQQLAGEQLQRLGSHSVADALRYFSGVQIKDYGGIGGLKTVNIRSMGTNHVGVFYDGIELGNAQNGQVDLGRFSLDNMEAVTLYNGQKSMVFQPAKDFGSAGSIYLQSRTPRFAEGERHHTKVSFKTGSFGVANPSVLWEQKFSERLAASFSAEYMYTTGRYKFRYRVQDGYDTTAVRRNGDVNALRAEANEHAAKLEGLVLVIAMRVGENDKLYGSVTSSIIGDALAEQGVDIDRRRILLDAPIRTLGEHTVRARLHADVVPAFTVKVVSEEKHNGEEEVVVEEAAAEVVETPAE